MEISKISTQKSRAKTKYKKTSTTEKQQADCQEEIDSCNRRLKELKELKELKGREETTESLTSTKSGTLAFAAKHSTETTLETSTRREQTQRNIRRTRDIVTVTDENGRQTKKQRVEEEEVVRSVAEVRTKRHITRVEDAKEAYLNRTEEISFATTHREELRAEPEHYKRVNNDRRKGLTKCKCDVSQPVTALVDAEYKDYQRAVSLLATEPDNFASELPLELRRRWIECKKLQELHSSLNENTAPLSKKIFCQVSEGMQMLTLHAIVEHYEQIIPQVSETWESDVFKAVKDNLSPLTHMQGIYLDGIKVEWNCLDGASDVDLAIAADVFQEGVPTKYLGQLAQSILTRKILLGKFSAADRELHYRMEQYQETLAFVGSAEQWEKIGKHLRVSRYGLQSDYRGIKPMTKNSAFVQLDEVQVYLDDDIGYVNMFLEAPLVTSAKLLKPESVSKCIKKFHAPRNGQVLKKVFTVDNVTSWARNKGTKGNMNGEVYDALSVLLDASKPLRAAAEEIANDLEQEDERENKRDEADTEKLIRKHTASLGPTRARIYHTELSK